MRNSKLLNSQQLLSLNKLLRMLKYTNVIGDYYIISKQKSHTIEVFKRYKDTIVCDSSWATLYVVEDVLVFDKDTGATSDIRISIS